MKLVAGFLFRNINNYYDFVYISILGCRALCIHLMSLRLACNHDDIVKMLAYCINIQLSVKMCSMVVTRSLSIFRGITV